MRARWLAPRPAEYRRVASCLYSATPTLAGTNARDVQTTRAPVVGLLRVPEPYLCSVAPMHQCWSKTGNAPLEEGGLLGEEAAALVPSRHSYLTMASLSPVPQAPAAVPGSFTVLQRLKLADLQVRYSIEVKKFQTSKNVSHPYYIFIASRQKLGWHLTIPMRTALSVPEAMNYEFYSYHITEEGRDNVHYQYDHTHKQDDTDVTMGAVKWGEADAVVREIFQVEPKPMYSYMQQVRRQLMSQKQFGDLQVLNKAITQAAAYLEITERELEAKLNADEETRLRYWQDVRKFVTG